MIRIITDSASDITQREAEKLGITVLPLHVRFDAEEFMDGVTIDADRFYDKLIESSILPKTSQIPPFQYEEAVKEFLAKGDDVLVITVSSLLSGCWNSALTALKDIRGNVALVDSRNVTLGQRILIELAVRLRDEGLSLQELTDRLEEEKKNVRVIALLDTLEYLKKGGRISSAKAMAGKILGIKPVIIVNDGVLELLGTARGSKSGGNLLIKYAKERGMNLEKPFVLGYSGNSSATLQKYIRDSKELYEGRDPEAFTIMHIGAVIGTHVGPGAIGFAFFKKD